MGSSAWELMELEILQQFVGMRGSRKRLMVVHPKDKYWNAAIAALDADDWNPDWPVPFYTRYEPRYGGVWIILEVLPELLLAN